MKYLQIISITQDFYLEKGTYNINLIGGFYCSYKQQPMLHNTKKNLNILIKPYLLKQQFYIEGKRGITIGKVVIEKSSNYKLVINDLSLKKSRLYFLRSFQKRIPYKNINVLIKKL
ncbi:hypothetical protein UJ101_01914 [Flavobacteriaceae bacterium UJ101]|nr:hypothetical protein UJ101_01914 [Flavobacteriaceae bacterium UJ101]